MKAARRLGRQFIGIDGDSQKVEIARRLISSCGKMEAGFVTRSNEEMARIAGVKER